jgi:hypothetical protein
MTCISTVGMASAQSRRMSSYPQVYLTNGYIMHSISQDGRRRIVSGIGSMRHRVIERHQGVPRIHDLAPSFLCQTRIDILQGRAYGADGG